MIDGPRQRNKLAELAGKQIKASLEELYDALHGCLTVTTAFCSRFIFNNGIG